MLESCFHVNIASETIPTINGINTFAFSHPSVPALLNPSNNPPKPKVDVITDIISSFIFFDSFTFLSAKNANTKSTIHIGVIKWNKSLQG